MPPSSPKAASLAGSRIQGLDSLRFVLASWVVLFHMGSFPFPLLERATDGLPYLARGVYHNLWNGQAAVIAFFVISGLCIHLPYRDHEIQPRTFFVRRYVRTVIPMLIALGLYRAIDVPLGVANQGFLWSLVCEEIYYTLYPILRKVRRRLAWTPLLFVSSVGAIAVLISRPNATNFDDLGPALTWIAGYPCWILGCVLAERIAKARSVGSEIWIWRVTAVLLGEMMMILRNHRGVALPLPLLAFSIFCFSWIGTEIDYFREHRPIHLLEKAGAWSYSLYLIHLGVYITWRTQPHADAQLAWLQATTLILGLSYLFYLFVERPSHHLARRFAAKLTAG